MAIFDLDTCRVDAVSLAGPAIGAPRARRKHSVRCDDDLRQVRLMAEDASASDLESEERRGDLVRLLRAQLRAARHERRLLGVRAAHGGWS